MFCFSPTDDPLLNDAKDSGPKFEDITTINVDEKLFQCNLCGKTYPRVQNLRVHLAGGDHNLPQFRHVSAEQLSCDFCDMKFVLQSRLRNHIRKVHGGVDESSSNNDNDVKIFPKFEEITTVDKNRGIFLCRLCGKNFPREHNLRVHLAGGDHNLPQFKTKNKFKWSKNKSTPSDLSRGFKSVKSEDNLDGTESVPAASVLITDRYSGSISELPAGQISLSQIESMGPALDPTHYPLPDPQPIEIYKCNQCPNVYKSKTYLNQHIKIVHEGKRAGNCERCGKCFFKIYF